jgi:aryl-alcohol dehydrogenase-like predicted oxidoreductase
MEYRKLGRSKLEVSRIGFGCMSLEEGTAADVLAKAVDQGLNFFDTADLYEKGRNEEWVGAALKAQRKNIILATKVGNQWRPDGSGWDWNPRSEYILECVEKSLRRLQTDYIDLYQLHGGTINDPTDEAIEAFELLQQQGKIRYYGISSIRPNVIRRWVEKSNIVSVMMQYSLLDRRPEESCLPLLQEKNIGVLTRGSLAQGLVVAKPSKPYLNHEAGTVEKAKQVIQSISAGQRSAGQSALRFVLQHPAVTSVIAGIRTAAQLQDAVQTLQTPALSNSERQKLNSIPALTYTEHR